MSYEWNSIEWANPEMPLEMRGVAFRTGAAVAFGLMGMAEAIRRNHLGILNVVRVRTKAGPVTFPPCDCPPDTVHTC